MTTVETPIAFTSADVTRTPEHLYVRRDSRIVPGVTSILAHTGLSVDFAALASMSRQADDALALRRELGTAVHADSHSWDDDDLDLETVDERVRPYLNAWTTCRENYGLVPVTRERLVYHPGLVYAGTMDGIFRLPSGRLILGDLCIGDLDDAGKRWQTAGYMKAFQVEHPDVPVTERWGIRLCPGKRIPYQIARYSDWRDFDVFAAAVTVYGHQPTRVAR